MLSQTNMPQDCSTITFGRRERERELLLTSNSPPDDVTFQTTYARLKFLGNLKMNTNVHLPESGGYIKKETQEV